MSMNSTLPDEPIAVVVVEDEMLIREAVGCALEDAGFVVYEAKDADDAMRILQTEAEHVDAIFTDVNMPGTMNGVTLAQHASGRWPWIRLVVASGQMNSAAKDLPKDSRFFQKPYDLSSVVTHIRSVTRPGL